MPYPEDIPLVATIWNLESMTFHDIEIEPNLGVYDASVPRSDKTRCQVVAMPNVDRNDTEEISIDLLVNGCIRNWMDDLYLKEIVYIVKSLYFDEYLHILLSEKDAFWHCGVQLRSLLAQI